MNNKLTYTIIKLAVENGIRYINDNPKRGVRNLLDLGEYFASGRFQKSFFNLAHEMLNNENSCYYEIVENIVKKTNPHTLSNFGINIGYNSFAYGASIIREHSKNNGLNIPWLLTLNFKDINENHLTDFEISDLIKCGKSLGIYSYMFLLNKNDIILELEPVMENNNDCAFIAVVSPLDINEQFVKKISNLPNICLLVTIDDIKKPDFINSMGLLRKYNCLFGGCFYYDDSNYLNIMNGTVSDKIISADCNLAVMIRKPNCGEEIAANTYDYIYKSRFKINSPVFMMDFYGDTTLINKIISDKSCFLSIDGIGQISVSNLENKTNFNIRTNSMEEILKSTN